MGSIRTMQEQLSRASEVGGILLVTFLLLLTKFVGSKFEQLFFNWPEG